MYLCNIIYQTHYYFYIIYYTYLRIILNYILLLLLLYRHIKYNLIFILYLFFI